MRETSTKIAEDSVASHGFLIWLGVACIKTSAYYTVRGVQRYTAFAGSISGVIAQISAVMSQGGAR